MLDARFWCKVARSSDSQCWEWQANKNNNGYGLFRPGGTAPKRLAHRLSFEAANGPIPPGMFVCHKCDNPKCVNPSHLFLGDSRANVADMIAKGRKVVVLNPNNRPPVLRGENHPRAKLTAEMVVMFRRRLSAGESLHQIARETGLSRRTLGRMRDGVSWAHVK